uniref:Transcription factor domain-containing protein n=1 Tax=Bionectria ochroleuca TaxID=29856 RepID=A0A0B7JU75_BIOOC
MAQRRTRAQNRQIKSHAAKAGNPCSRLRKSSTRSPSRRYHAMRSGDKTHEHASQLVVVPTLGPGPELTEVPGLAFSAALTPLLLYNLGKFFSCLSIKMYPERLCTEADSEDVHWVGTMFHNQMYFHSVVSASEAFFNTPGEGTRHLKSQHHSLMALQLLQNKVSKEDITDSASDTTIMSVLLLAVAADMADDLPTVDRHLRGLKRMIDMRGGFQLLQTEVPDLLAKICRIDLALAVRTWRDPVFFHDSISWTPYLLSNCRRSGESDAVQTGLALWIGTLDYRLRIVREDLVEFCSMSNSASQRNQKLPRSTFSEILLSLIYRLLNLSFELDSAEETIRLGMLAYTSTMFLQWHNHMVEFYHLRCMLGATLRNLDNENLGASLPVQLWLFFAWHMLQPPECEYRQLDIWLERLLCAGGLSAWSEVRQLLRSTAWIDYINGVDGEKVYNRTMMKVSQP